jgi:hypothetical protein
MPQGDVPAFVWSDEVPQDRPLEPEWIWHGFVARAATTLLVSQWKAGKTTLLTMLLARRAHGGSLAGLAVAPGKTVVVTEESPAIWARRIHRYALGGSVCLLHRPFSGVPRPQEWQVLIRQIVALKDRGVDLAVLDPLAPLLPCENDARSVLESLHPLTELLDAGMGVQLMHHPAKGQRLAGQSARGSGALLGHVDIAIEMRHPGGDMQTRRRRFLALSRFPETPRQLLLELNADATDYLPVPDTGDDSEGHTALLREVLAAAPGPLTRDAILAAWPPGADKPGVSTLKRWLTRGVGDGTIACEGAGHRTDPLRYWLCERA